MFLIVFCFSIVAISQNKACEVLIFTIWFLCMVNCLGHTAWIQENCCPEVWGIEFKLSKGAILTFGPFCGRIKSKWTIIPGSFALRVQWHYVKSRILFRSVKGFSRHFLLLKLPYVGYINLQTRSLDNNNGKNSCAISAGNVCF